MHIGVDSKSIKKIVEQVKMTIKKQLVTEVTGAEPCASASSAISALATRLQTSESMILFFNLGVKAFFASFCASFASLIAFLLPE